MSSPSNIDQLLELTKRHLQVGNLGGAIETLRQTLAEEPDHADAHALLSLLLHDQKRLYAAEHESKIALALEPEGRLPLLASGKIELANRRFSAAIERYEHLHHLDPTDPRPLQALAEVHSLRGKPRQALPFLEQALALDPDDPDVLTDLGHWHLKAGHVDQAEQFAREALQISPEDHDGLILMGHVLVYRDRLDEAREHAVWALQKNPASGSALALMVTIKTRRSLILGLWWRYSVWMGALGEGRAVLVLLGAFMLYRFGVITAQIQGRGNLSDLIQVFWLGIVAYTWFGPALFQQSLRKELATVRLNRNF